GGPQGLRGLTVKLARDDVPIEGRVVDLEGKPMGGVTVRVLDLAAGKAEDLGPWVKALQTDPRESWMSYPQTRLDPAAAGLSAGVTTGADGRFRIAGAGRERLLTLRFEGPTIETREAFVMTRPGTTVHAARTRGQQDFVYATVHGAR